MYETGEVGETAYIVMEYVEGQTLKEKMEQGALPLKDSLRVAFEIAEALEEAHRKGIVHRDLKPANIILTAQGHAKVMDFGLAKRVLPSGDDLTSTLTQTITEQGTVVGTLAYMSPEQARGGAVDGRSDIFSLGIILDEMISGKHPFSKPTPVETLTAVLRDNPPPVNIKPKSANPAVDHVLQKALAKNPAERYQNVTELAVDLRKLQKEIEAGGLRLRRRAALVGSFLISAVFLAAIWRFFFTSRVSIPRAAPKPISVLVADFQNKTGDSVFDGALEQALGISLEGASFISVYKHPQAHKVAKQLAPNADDRLDGARAQLVSRREGISTVIEASIEASGEGYVLKAAALDPATSKKLAEASEKIKTKAQVLQATHSLAVKLTSELGEVSPESVEALKKETFSSSSLDAMRAYSVAQDLAGMGKQEEAIKEYLRALDYDPKLGRAYAGLAVIYFNRGQSRETEKYYQLAMARIDQMTDREKYRTRGAYYIFKQDYQKAIEEYGSLVQQFPVDGAGYTNLAFAYFSARNMPQALKEGLRAVELNPRNVNIRYNLGWYAMGAGDFELAQKEELKVLEENASFEKAYLVLALSDLAQGQCANAAETYKKLEASSSFGASLMGTGLADIAVYEGRLRDAEGILKKGIASDLATKLTDLAADKCIMLANVLLPKQKAEALDAADRAVAASPVEEILFSAAQVYLQAGREDKARTLSEELGKKIQPINQAYAKIITGEINLRRKEIPAAIRTLKEAQSLTNTWLGRLALGRAYIEAGAFAQASSELDLCLKRRGEATSIFFNDLPSYRYFPAVYYYLGRAQEGLKSPAAKESYEKFLKIKERANPGDPLVEDARKRLESL